MHYTLMLLEFLQSLVGTFFCCWGILSVRMPVAHGTSVFITSEGLDHLETITKEKGGVGALLPELEFESATF